MRDKVPLPSWKRRRWLLLKRFLSDPLVKNELDKYKKWANQEILPLSFFGLMAERHLPSECWDAVLLKLNKPAVSDDELIEAISSPVEYISNYYQVRGQAADSRARYAEERSKTERKIETYGSDRAYEDTAVYIRISPFTNYSEVQGFIKDNWAEIQPLLDKSHHESRGEFDPELLKPGSRLRDRGKRDAIDAYIVEMHSSGMKSPEIRDKVHDEYGMWIDESNVRKIISRYKKRP